MAFILTDRNALLRLRERDTPSKLELLFRKNLYPMAISLAYASDHDVSEILGIYREGLVSQRFPLRGPVRGVLHRVRMLRWHFSRRRTGSLFLPLFSRRKRKRPTFPPAEVGGTAGIC